MELLNQIVKDMLEEHEGGEEFFNHLDSAVQHNTIIQQLINLINWDEDLKNISKWSVVVSGKFGKFFNNYIIPSHIKIVVVNGGLREDEPIDDLSYIKKYINNNNFIFIDDSFYSGKTKDVIKNELEKHGGKLIKTFVVYDGSKEKDPDVKSLYRYYDYN